MPSIALNVGRKFLDPPVPIGMRRRAVFRAGVPEAAVKENRDTFRWKEYVRPSPCNPRYGPIHLKTQMALLE